MTPRLGNDERKGRVWKVAATAMLTALTMLLLFALLSYEDDARGSQLMLAALIIVLFMVGVWTLWIEKEEWRPESWSCMCRWETDGKGEYKGMTISTEYHYCNEPIGHKGNHVCSCGEEHP